MDDRIARAAKYIDERYAEDIDLDLLAGVACLSRFRFSRLFAAETGEPAFERLARVRVERAASALASGDGKIADIAFRCGFGSLSAFNAAFSSRMGMPPSRYRRDAAEKGKEPEAIGKVPREPAAPAAHTGLTDFKRRALSMSVDVIDFPAARIAYVCKKGDLMDTRPAWDALLSWAAARALRPPERLFIGMSDDPTLVPAEECRFYACVSLPEGFAEEPGEVEFDLMEGGPCAAYDFFDKPERLVFAYGTVIGEWLPLSGYEQDGSRPCFEINLNDPAADPEGRSRARLCVPIRPRR